MKDFLCWSVIALLLTGACAEAAVTKKMSGNRNDGKILSNGCVMSYTDSVGNFIRVIRGNPITIYLR